MEYIVRKIVRFLKTPFKVIKGAKHKKSYSYENNNNLIKNFNYKQNIHKLMIVAHPDDETIFGGRFLLENEDTFVICLTNQSNTVRSNEFKGVMNYYKTRYVMLDFPDCEYGFDRNWLNSKVMIKEFLEEIKANNNIELVVSHNLKGEYGHIAHKICNEVVTNVFDNVKCFGLMENSLNTEVLNKKKEIMSLYKSQKTVVFGEIKKYYEHENVGGKF